MLSEQATPVMTTSSDGDLLARVNADDPDSLETLYDRYSPFGTPRKVVEPRISYLHPMAEYQMIRYTERSSRMSEVTKVGKRGTLVIPAPLRKRYGLEEGREVLIEETAEGLLLRPAVTLPVEMYSKERRAAFLLENAVDRRDYERAREEVRKLGLDPDAIPHERPET